MKNNFKMTTVYEFAQLLDDETKQKEQNIKKAVNAYMTRTQQANENAQLLEKLLA